MNRDEALRILGIEYVSDKATLKKNYRKLMHQVHPDNGQKAMEYVYSAQEINAAYTFLCKLEEEIIETEAKEKKRQKQQWNAPVNSMAYCDRPVFEDVIDSDGNSLGLIVIAEGKYVFIHDEDFSMFIKSIFAVSKSLLDEIDLKLQRSARVDFIMYQAELAYLLGQQFVDSTKTLFDMNMDVDSNDSEDTFYIPAMLDANGINITPSTNIYPIKVKNHKLYVCNEKKQDLGYISFEDDLISFALTPLFSQKDVKVKIEVAQKQGKIARGQKRYVRLDLWIKVPVNSKETNINSLNSKIESILEKYSAIKTN